MNFFLKVFLTILIGLIGSQSSCFSSGPLLDSSEESDKMEAQIVGPKKAVGYLEKLSLMKNGLKFKVKLDTGAKISSLHVENYRIFERDGEQFVEFKIPHPKKRKIVRFERPLERITSIKNRMGMDNEEDDFDEIDQRPVVKLKFCLGDEAKVFEVNLTNRANMIYPMILGRNALMEFNVTVDSSQKFTQKLACIPTSKEARNHLSE